MFGEGNFITQDIGKRGIPVLAFERSGAVQHFIYQNAKSPPVHRACMSTAFDDFRCNILFGTHEGVRSEVRNT